ncbi:MAG: DUF2062 domain-containing protein [Sterolibacterium sp.]
MRKQFKKFLPDHRTLIANRWLAPFGSSLLHPRLWHLNRRSAAGAVAAGIFCGLIPAPFQMLSAAICAVIFRVNLPLAILTTLYTNPLTIVPLYIVAFALGQMALGEFGSGKAFILPPDYGTAGLWAWIGALIDWMIGLGTPLALGLVLLGALLAVAGYIAVRFFWRIYLLRAWRRRGHSTCRRPA